MEDLIPVLGLAPLHIELPGFCCDRADGFVEVAVGPEALSKAEWGEMVREPLPEFPGYPALEKLGKAGY